MLNIPIKLKKLLNGSLYRNSMFLVLSRVLNLTSGFFFWIIAGKLYPTKDVGLGTALISILGLIMLSSRFGFDFSLIRFINKYDKAKVFNTSLFITTTAALTISFLYKLIEKIFVLEPMLNLDYTILFIIVVLANSITLITGNMFCALRKAHLFFIQNFILSLRIILLFPLVIFNCFGIFLALGISYFLSSVFALWILDKETQINLLDIDRSFVNESYKFSAGNYFSNILYEAPALVLPIMVLHLLGEDQAAKFYMAFMLGNITIIVPSALSTSLFVEGSNDKPLKENIPKVILAVFVYLIPLVTAFCLFGKGMLGFINKEYMDAMNLLRLIVLSSFFAALHLIFMTVQNVRMKVHNNVIINLIRFLLIVGFSYLFIINFKLIGVGMAWIISYALLLLVIMLIIYRDKTIKIDSRWLLNRFKYQYKTVYMHTISAFRILLSTVGAFIFQGGKTKVPHFFGEDNRFRLTGRIIAYLLICLAIGGISFPLFLGKYNLSLLGVYLGIPMICAPIVWLKIKEKQESGFSLDKNIMYCFAILFLLCYCLSVYVLHAFAVRTLVYYIIVTIMGFLILCQIVFFDNLDNKQKVVILMQISGLLLNIIWGVNLKYYYFIGRTDTLVHSWLIQNLINQGQVTEIFNFYQAFPLWHILCTIIYKLCNVTLAPYKVMFITNGLIYSMLPIMVYLAADKITNNTKIAFLSALFMCFNPDVIFCGMYSIPRSVVACIVVLLMLLLLHKKNSVKSLLLIVVTIATVMYHPASMPFIWLIFLLIYVFQKIYQVDKEDYIISFNYLITVFFVTITYWMYYGEKVFNAIVKNFYSSGPSGVLTKSIVNTPLNELFNYLQYSPLLFFLICGVLWAVMSERIKNANKLFFILALVLVFVTFPGPALLINKFARNLNLFRFGEYSYFFISLAGASGFYILFYKLRKHFRVCVVFIFLIMAFLSVSNDFTASDNPVVKRPFYTFYLKEKEIISLNHLAEVVEGYIMSDFAAVRYLENSSYAHKSHILEIDNEGSRILTNDNSDILVIRKEELATRPLRLFSSSNGDFQLDPSFTSHIDYYYHYLPVWDTLDSLNIIYDSGAVVGLKY
ncbi:MAG: hypothetical protein APF76_12260 [Desulfitibacter sp. BRH_c19]|nr:MAG: hypothetical protein APF76_12260 [Desulfitibacter sp. BRH_c19]